MTPDGRFSLILIACLSLFSLNSLQAQLSVVQSINHVSCNGFNDGSVGLTISGGVGPYEVQWIATAGTGFMESGLGAGTHPVMIIDHGTNSTLFIQVTVSEPDPLVVQFVGSSSASCAGICDGALQLEIMGGTPPYNISWPPGAIVSLDGLSANSLCPGVHTVAVSDANGCSSVASAVIEEPEPMYVSFNSVDATCSGNYGSVVLYVNGGTPPYSFNWSNGATTPNLSGLASGYYSVELIDDLGCTINAGISIGGPITNQFLASSGLWNEPNNWSQGMVPDESHYVIIADNRTCHIPAGYNALCIELEVGPGSELTMDNTSCLLALGC